MAGFVYFISTADGSSIKIGFSVNPSQRFRALQGSHGAPLRAIRSLPGSRATERALHERFKHLRQRGEWFSPGADLLAYIEALPSRRSRPLRPSRRTSVVIDGDLLVEIDEILEARRKTSPYLTVRRSGVVRSLLRDGLAAARRAM